MKRFKSVVSLALLMLINLALSHADLKPSEDPDLSDFSEITTESENSETASYSTSAHENIQEVASSRPEVAAKPPFFDLTDAIDNNNFSEIADLFEGTFNHTSKIYYKTDKLLSEITSLDWLATELSRYHVRYGKESSKFCLTIAFKMTVNQTAIDMRHLEDILTTQMDTKDSVQGLKDHLCGVVLDFTLGGILENSSQLDNDSFEYVRKWDISFTKYAKKLLGNIFGDEKKLHVGVLYNDMQLKKEYAHVNQILLEQETQFADFLIVNVEFAPIYRMPLYYYEFHQHFVKTDFKVREHLKKLSEQITRETRNMNKKVKYMVTWRNDLVKRAREYYGPINTIINATQSKYLNKFHKFFNSALKTLSHQCKFAAISGTTFEILNLKQKSNPYEEWMANRDSKYILPYLYVQEADTSACQLRSMLRQIAEPIDTLVVNEFTFSAIARNEDNIRNPLAENCDQPELELKVPNNVLLFASPGIGKFWNKSKTSFRNLVENRTNIAGMNLNTIVFSADDLAVKYPRHDNYPSMYSSPTTARYSLYHSSDLRRYGRSSGISKFVESWVAANNSGVGCLVDMSKEHLNDGYEVIYFAERMCFPIYDNLSVYVLQITVNSSSNAVYKFGFDFGLNSIKRKLFNLLIAREVMKWDKRNTEIVLNIVVNDGISPEEKRSGASICDMRHRNQIHLQKELLTWAKIHEIKLVSSPVFDLKNPNRGTLIPPLKDGSPDVEAEKWKAC